MSSPAQIAANQANAQRSTGPTTKAGKARSRRNALKHGLRAEVIDFPEIEAVKPPVLDTTAGLDAAWLWEQVNQTTAQIDQARRVEPNLRAEAALRASTVWESERVVEAEALGARLGRQPAWTVARLRRTPAGCDWLSTRWEWLKWAATAPEGWNEAQTKLAFDLLGVDAAFRSMTVVEAVVGRMTPPNLGSTPLAIAESMLAELAEYRERVVAADERAQTLAANDLIDLPTPADPRKGVFLKRTQTERPAAPIAARSGLDRAASRLG